jgi:hypothetical protein
MLYKLQRNKNFTGRTVMLSDHKIANKQITVFSNEVELVDLDLGNSKLGIGIIMALAGFVGFWGTICLINGFIQANSIKQIGQGLITAMTGL